MQGVPGGNDVVDAIQTANKLIAFSLFSLLLATMQGLWRGTIPGLLLTVPYTAVQFVAAQQCKQLAKKYGLTGRPADNKFCLPPMAVFRCMLVNFCSNNCSNGTHQ